MPYIKQVDRNKLNVELDKISEQINTGGELNYVFTFLCKRFVESKGKNYSNYSTCVSSLECAKIEFYRRFIAPYEDIKIKENGDVD